MSYDEGEGFPTLDDIRAYVLELCNTKIRIFLLLHTYLALTQRDNYP